MLEWMPETFIPHAGARYHQTTGIHLSPGSSLLFLDWISPGRVATGETFAYQNLRWELDLFSAGRLVVRERFDLRPDGAHLEALRAMFPAAHFISVFAAGDFACTWPSDELDSLSSGAVYLGHGPLRNDVHVVRALCRDGISARSTAAAIRRALYRNTGRMPPSLGRIPA